MNLNFSYPTIYSGRNSNCDRDIIEISGNRNTTQRLSGSDIEIQQQSKKAKLDLETDSDDQGLKRQVSQNIRSESHSPRTITYQQN